MRTYSTPMMLSSRYRYEAVAQMVEWSGGGLPHGCAAWPRARSTHRYNSRARHGAPFIPPPRHVGMGWHRVGALAGVVMAVLVLWAGLDMWIAVFLVAGSLACASWGVARLMRGDDVGAPRPH